MNGITIRNFKAVGDKPLRIDFKPITLLFGPNSAGKSTVLQALHYAREYFVHRRLNPEQTSIGGETLNLGGFRSLVHKHDLSTPITLSFHGTKFGSFLQEDEAIAASEWAGEYLDCLRYAHDGDLTISIKWLEKWKRAIPVSFEVSVNGEPFGHVKAGSGDLVVNRKHRLLNLAKRHDGRNIGSISRLAKHFMARCNQDSNSLDFPLCNFLAHQDWDRPLVYGQWDFEDEENEENLNIIIRSDNPFDSYEYGYVRNAFHEVINRLSGGQGKHIKETLMYFRYLGPLRRIIPRSFSLVETPPGTGWADGLAAWDALFLASSQAIAEINHWLSDPRRLDCGYTIEAQKYQEVSTELIHELELAQKNQDSANNHIINAMAKLPLSGKIVLRECATGLEVHPHDVGIGISQLVPTVVASLTATNPDSYAIRADPELPYLPTLPNVVLIAIEQPELHIHPALQVRLADLFISQINKVDNEPKSTNSVKELIKPIFILETHSEHMMLRFLRRIRETSNNELPEGAPPLKSDDVAVYYFSKSAEGVDAQRLRIDDQGEFIDRWPKGFFEERAEELF